jgi:putative heme-binding domain-containing protein
MPVPPPPKGASATSTQRADEENALALLKTFRMSALDTLLSTSSGALSVALAVIDGSLPEPARAQAIAKGSALADPLRRDLFERFLPESQRRKVLGPDFNPAALLGQKGDPVRGQALFASVCIACHRAQEIGTDFGPDLTHIATKWNPAAMIEQILTPSKIIEPQWKLTTVELKNGETKTGFPAATTATELTLKQAGGLTEKIPATDIAKTSTSPVSMMPEGLLQSLTAQEAADLLQYLQSLK